MRKNEGDCLRVFQLQEAGQLLGLRLLQRSEAGRLVAKILGEPFEKPYACLGNNYGSGTVYGTVGYAISNKDTPIATPSTNDIGDGVVVAGGWDHWGSGGPWGHQVLGSYNFDSEAFWGRGRLTRRLSMTGAAQKRFGGEVAFLSGDGYSAVQPGVIYEMHNGRGSILGLGAGMKFFEGAGNAVYFKIEGVLPVAR